MLLSVDSGKTLIVCDNWLIITGMYSECGRAMLPVSSHYTYSHGYVGGALLVCLGSGI